MMSIKAKEFNLEIIILVYCSTLISKGMIQQSANHEKALLSTLGEVHLISNTLHSNSTVCDKD
jgi:hypothetical protein